VGCNVGNVVGSIGNVELTVSVGVWVAIPGGNGTPPL
jgi:hypothetical protein